MCGILSLSLHHLSFAFHRRRVIRLRSGRMYRLPSRPGAPPRQKRAHILRRMLLLIALHCFAAVYASPDAMGGKSLETLRPLPFFSLRRAAALLFGASLLIVFGMLYRMYTVRRPSARSAMRRRKYLQAKVREAKAKKHDGSEMMSEPPNTPDMLSMMDGSSRQVRRHVHTAQGVPRSASSLREPSTGVSSMRRRTPRIVETKVDVEVASPHLSLDSREQVSSPIPILESLTTRENSENDSSMQTVGSENGSFNDVAQRPMVVAAGPGNQEIASSQEPSPTIPSVVDVLKAKGSARQRLLNERRELLMKKGDAKTKQQRGRRTSGVRRSLLSRDHKSPMKISRASTLRAMR